MKTLRILGAVALLGTCFLPAAAMAASDGSVGTTSTGTAAISVVIPQLIRARNFNDLDLGTYTGTGGLADDDDLNISTNYSTGQYRVKATSAEGSFVLTDGAQTIAYTAYFNDATGTSGRSGLTYNTNLTGQTGAAVTLGASTLNANLSVTVTEAALQAVDASTYSGTISLLFTPE